jgi:hypothetical protein
MCYYDVVFPNSKRALTLSSSVLWGFGVLKENGN